MPLKTNAHIIEGNALQIDWETVIPSGKLSYIMGNPPFVGGMYMTETQKDEIRNIFDNVTGAGEFDYVTGWYKKAVKYTLGTKISCAFVSTNSICQGSQVITFWKHLIMVAGLFPPVFHRGAKKRSRFLRSSFFVSFTPRDRRHPCPGRRWGRPSLRGRLPRRCRGLLRFRGRLRRGHRHSRRGTRTSWLLLRIT